MHFEEIMTDAAVLAELGRRLERHRLERNWTQAELAAEAGVGQATVQRAERGRSVQMTSMIKLLRTLGLLAGLDAAVPESIDLPIAQLEREQRKTRRRARGTRGSLNDRGVRDGRDRGTTSDDRGVRDGRDRGTTSDDRDDRGDPPFEPGQTPWTWGDEPGAAR
jgi:transcriptional regulator with XRE-family HTH domain